LEFRRVLFRSCRDAPDHGCGRSFACGTSYAWVVTCAYPLLSSFFLGRDGFDFLGLTTNDLAFENPNLHTDHTISGVGFSRRVVDVGTQGVQRLTAFTVPLGTGDLGAAEKAADLDLDTFGTDTHGVLYSTLHGAIEYQKLRSCYTCSGRGFSRRLVDVGTQGVQRHTAITVHLGTDDLGAAETAADLDLDTLGTDTHGVLYSTLHGATEHHAAFQLL